MMSPDLMEMAAAEIAGAAAADEGGPVAFGTAIAPVGGDGVAAPLRPLPKALSAPNPPRGMTIQDAFMKYFLPETLQEYYLEVVGSEDGSEEAEVAAHVPPNTIFEGMDSYITNMGKPLTPLGKGHLAKFVKAMRRDFVDVPAVAPSIGTSAPVAEPIVVQLPDTSDRQPFKDYIDQTIPGSFDVLSASEITQLRRNYVKSTGTGPTNAERPTDEQLSALSHRLRPQKNGRINSPWVEFAVFGPYSSRSARLRQFTAHVLTRDGQRTQKQLRGPTSVEQWEACWDVFACSMVMLGVATTGVLRQYAAGIKRLATMFKDHWATVFTLDEEMRCEQWDRLRQEIEDGDVLPPPGYNPEFPWLAIISATRFGYLAGPRADWWRERETLLERATRIKPTKAIGGLNALAPPPFPGGGSGGVDTEDFRLVKQSGGAASSSGGGAGSNGGGGGPGKNANKNRKRKDKKAAAVMKGAGKGGKPSGKQIGPCHTCGEYGHLKKDCPKGKAADKTPANQPSKEKGRRSQK